MAVEIEGPGGRQGGRTLTALVHVLIGSAAGVLSRGSGSAAGRGLLSHICLDLLPHRDYGSTLVGAFDGACAAAALLFGLRRGGFKAFLGGLAAVLPDIEVVLKRLWNRELPGGAHFPTHDPHGGLGHGRASGTRARWGEAALGLLALAVLLRGTKRTSRSTTGKPAR